MFLYTLIEALVGIIVGILIAVRTKKAESVTYNKLDKAGRVTNLLLAIAYICFSPVYLFLGMISTAAPKGFLGIIAWIVCIIIASAALFCALGLGFSVALRKKGRSKLSFAVQFAGVVGIGLAILLYSVCTPTLVKYLN